MREEHETPRGWRYRVLVHTPGRAEAEHHVSLSWVDHHHYSGGLDAPSTTVERVVRALLEAIERSDLSPSLPKPRAAALPPRFDVSLARRLAPGLDARLRRAG